MWPDNDSKSSPIYPTLRKQLPQPFLLKMFYFPNNPKSFDIFALPLNRHCCCCYSLVLLRNILPSFLLLQQQLLLPLLLALVLIVTIKFTQVVTRRFGSGTLLNFISPVLHSMVFSIHSYLVT